MRRVVENQLKPEVHDDPYREQVADGRQAPSQEFTSMATTEDEPEEVGRMSRLGVAEPSSQAQKDGGHWLQDEAEASGTGEPPRQFLEELPREHVHATLFKGVYDSKR